MSAPVHSALTGLASKLERASFLDPVASAVGDVVRKGVGTGAFKDLLSGTWLGHPLHPLLTDTVIGTWTSALLLDLTGGRGAQKAADRLVLAGVLAYGPTALTGNSDWADSMADHGAQRVGLIHAGVNAVGLALQLGSLAARRADERPRGVALSITANAVIGLGGWLGGHMSYKQGVGVDQTTFDPGPEYWADAGPASAVVEGTPLAVDVDGTPVVLIRQGAEVFALHDRCCHRGFALSENHELGDGTITCTAHGSCFRLRDGGSEQGPAVYDQPSFEVRELAGVLAVRLSAAARD